MSKTHEKTKGSVMVTETETSTREGLKKDKRNKVKTLQTKTKNGGTTDEVKNKNVRDNNKTNTGEKNQKNVTGNGKRKVSKKTKKKDESRKKRLAAELFITETYDPCVHLHFKPEYINRECLTHGQYLEMLATPKGYRWAGEVNCYNPELEINKLRKKRKRRTMNFIQSEAGDGEEDENTFCDVVTPEITGRLIHFLVNEFGMPYDEAEDFIDSTQKTCAIKQPLPKEKKSKQYTSMYKWTGEYLQVFSKLFEQYLIAMLTKKRTPRVRKIAEVIVNRACDLTNEKISMDKPKKKSHKIIVHIADRLAFWIDDVYKAERKRKAREEDKLESDLEVEEESKDPGEEAIEEKEKPKDEKQGKTQNKEEEKGKEKETEKVEQKEGEKEPENKEEKEPDKKEEVKEPDNKEKEKEPDKKEEEKEPDKKEEEKEPDKKEEEKEPDKKEEEKEPENKKGVEEQENKEEQKEPEKKDSEKEPEQKEEEKEPEKVEEKESEKVEEKESEKVEEKESENKDTENPEENEEEPKEEAQEPEKEDEPQEPKKQEEEEDKSEKTEEEKGKEGGEQENDEEAVEEQTTKGDEELEKDDKIGQAPEETISEEKPVRDTKPEEIKPKNLDEKQSSLIHPRRIRGFAFEVKPKTESKLEVQKLSSTTVAQVTAKVRGDEAPPKKRRVPDTDSPLNLRSAEDWADWAENIASMAKEWGNWLENRLTDAEKQILDLRKSQSHWQAWRDQGHTEALKWRVEEGRIKEEAEIWKRKIDENLKNKPETEIKTTEYS